MDKGQNPALQTQAIKLMMPGGVCSIKQLKWSKDRFIKTQEPDVIRSRAKISVCQWFFLGFAGNRVIIEAQGVLHYTSE